MVAQLDREYLRTTRSRTLVRLISYGLFEGRPPTTRGKFVNRLVFAQLRAADAHRHQRTVREPIFLVGIGRGGTTLLGRLLSTHRQVGFLNEPRAMWDIIIPAHDVSDFFSRGGQYLLTPEDATPAVQRTAHCLFSWYASATRSRRVVDKSPEMLYRVPFLKQIFPDCRIVAIARQPGPTIKSIGLWSRNNQADGADWWGVGNAKWKNMVGQLVPRHGDIAALLAQRAEPTDQDKAAVEWLVGTRAIAAGQAGGEIDSFVRYEDLVNEPDRTMTRILADVDLPPDARVGQYARQVVRPTHTTVTAASLSPLGDWADLIAASAGAIGYEVEAA